jgi:hypothetical protein
MVFGKTKTKEIGQPIWLGRIFGKSENEKKERRGSFIEKPLDYFKRSWQFPRT